MMRKYHKQSHVITKTQSTEHKKHVKKYDKERRKDPHRIMIIRKAQDKYKKLPNTKKLARPG